MSGRGALWSAAIRRIRGTVLLPLVGGNLLLFFAAVLWLKIPDSHSWQLLVSLLLALGLVAGLLLWNAVAVRRVRQPAEMQVLWKGALILGLWIALAAALVHLVGLAEPNVEMRAGYWNSQMSAGLRHVLTYGRLVTLQQWALDAVRWIVLPALCVPFVIETVSFALGRGALRRGLGVLFTPAHWLVAVLASGFASWSVPGLLRWHPTHTVTGEAVSATLRFILVAVIAIGAALALLAVDAELLERRYRPEPPRL